MRIANMFPTTNNKEIGGEGRCQTGRLFGRASRFVEARPRRKTVPQRFLRSAIAAKPPDNHRGQAAK